MIERPELEHQAAERPLRRAARPGRKADRVDLRVPEYVKRRIKAAADLLGRSTTDFILAAALEEAERVTESVERWQLSEKQSAFVYQLLAAPKENPELGDFLRKWEAD
jgi:uncharacterized protein (DUF1778 family)